MSLQSDQLITFAVVARTGSVSAAANQLYRSQPAISSQLKSLTETVGEALYVRHRHGVRLTEAGEALLPHAQALSRALAGAQNVVNEFKGLERGKLRVAASMTNAVYLLPEVFAAFKEAHPGVELELLTRNTQEAVALLHYGEADLALTEGPVHGRLEDFEYRVVLEDEIVLVVRPDHALARRKRVRLSDLRGVEVVQREEGSGTREVVERALEAENVTVDLVMQATGIEAVKEAVLVGLGAGFISSLAARREVAAGLLVSFPLGIAFSRPLTLIHPSLEHCSGAAKAFLQALGAR